MVNPPGARPVFKTVCIKDSNPETFARKHQEALNSLVSDGWNIVERIDKGGALILVGMRHETGEAPEVEEETAFVLPASSTDRGHVEIVYTYIQGGKAGSTWCASMPDAMIQVREHMNTVSEEILPLQITVMSVQTYDPLQDYKVLDRLYPDRSRGK